MSLRGLLVLPLPLGREISRGILLTGRRGRMSLRLPFRAVSGDSCAMICAVSVKSDIHADRNTVLTKLRWKKLHP